MTRLQGLIVSFFLIARMAEERTLISRSPTCVGCQVFQSEASDRNNLAEGSEVNIEKEFLKEDRVIKVYPNPFESYIKIEIESKTNQKMNVKLFNQYGQTISYSGYELKKGDNQFTIMSKQREEQGIYYLKISFGEISYFQKIIKQ
jgi:hypothetical protein